MQQKIIKILQNNQQKIKKLPTIKNNQNQNTILNKNIQKTEKKNALKLIKKGVFICQIRQIY